MNGRRARFGALFFLGLALTFVPVQLAIGDQVVSACTGTSLAASAATEVGAEGAATLQAVGGNALVNFPFGIDRQPVRRSLSFNVAPATQLSVSEISVEPDSDFLRTDSKYEFPPEQVFYTVQVLRKDRVKLNFCLSPTTLLNVPQGKYQGTVSIAGPNINTTALTLTATLQYNNTTNVLVVVLIGALVGFVLKLATDVDQLMQAPSDGTAPPGGRSRFWNNLASYLTRVSTWVWVAFGAGATVGAWYLVFSSNPSFGADLKDFGLLFVGAAAAMVSGATGPQGIAALAALRTSSGDANPPAGGANPPAGGANPPAGGANPPAGGANPPAGGANGG